MKGPGRLKNKVLRLQKQLCDARNQEAILSSHVSMVPWCNCCAQIVATNHICSCEENTQALDTGAEGQEA